MMNVPTNEQMVRAQAAAAAQVAAMSSAGVGGMGGDMDPKANPLGPFFQHAAASMAAGFHPQGPQVPYLQSRDV